MTQAKPGKPQDLDWIGADRLIQSFHSGSQWAIDRIQSKADDYGTDGTAYDCEHLNWNKPGIPGWTIGGRTDEAMDRRWMSGI